MGLVEIVGAEFVNVDNENAIVFEAAKPGFQGGGVECDQGIVGVAGGEDFLTAESKLIARDAGEGASGGADFGGKVGEGDDVVAHADAGLAELAADGLNAIARVAREINHDIS